ncbi:MAG: hypothetical protein RSC93_07330 [Erysipelotrichaceae bacterium]
MYKKFIIKLISLIVILLILISGSIIILDPFYQYHKPLFGLKPIFNNERYQNPGIAKNFDYDAMLLGSSMTENFRVSQINDTFDCNAVKLSFEASRTGNMNHMLSLGYKNHEIKKVFIGLDIDALIEMYGTYRFPIPEYLYDNNILNDVNYVLNKSVIFDTAKWILDNKRNNIPDIDLSYNWAKNYTFSRKKAIDSVEWDIEHPKEKTNNPLLLVNAMENLNKNILPHIKNNPNTEFYIFYPPYSVLWWNIHENYGDLDCIYEVVDNVTKELLKYNNVKLYNFQIKENLVTDLDNYKDYNHYSDKINSEILNWMKKDEYLVTKDNSKETLNKLKKIISEYDYASIAKEIKENK